MTMSWMPYSCRVHCCSICTPQDGKVVNEMPVPPKQRPEHIGHGQADVGVGDITPERPRIEVGATAA